MLKLIFSLLPSFVLSSVVALPSATIAIAAEPKPTTVQIAQGPEGYTFNEENVHQMTVKVSTAKNQGSGTLIGQQGDSYLVLTNAHVLNGDTTLQVQTHDGQNYTAQVVANAFRKGYDLVLVKFQSSNAYQIADISTATPQVSLSLITGGYAAESGTFQSDRGTVEQMRAQPLQEGYQLGYSGDVPQGMSGGPIFDVTGELVGIQGRSKFPLVDEYGNQDGTAIPTAEIQQIRQRNWGIPIRTALAQIEQPLLVAYDLPLPKTEIGITRPNWMGWTAEIEAKAKGFTVLIKNTHKNTGGNGSGVIIARLGNTYTVLTSEHNFKDRENANTSFTLTTHDGQTHALDKRRFRLEPGVDLAVVEFESDINYPVATLAKYQQENYAQVFVAGFPDPLDQRSPQWLMSGGLVYDREQGRLHTIERNVRNKQQEGELAPAAPSTAFDLGYDLLYTSITYKGMSGGPVLDHQGRVIGIHGLAESENEGNLVGQSAGQQQQGPPIQFGNSLGIPIQTFLSLASRFQVQLNKGAVEETQPGSLTSQQMNLFRGSLFSIQVPTGNAKPEVLIERGNQLSRIGLYKKAIDVFDKVIALNRGYEYLAYFGKAQAYLFQDKSLDYKKVIKALQTSIQKQPGYTTAWKYLATVYRQSGQYKDALVAINKALKLRGEKANLYDANLYNELHSILRDLEQYRDALVAINKALQLSERAAFYSNRGVTYESLKQYDQAIEDYNQAIKLNPYFFDAYYNRGLTYQDLKQYDQAIKNFNQVIKINPEFSDAYNSRGNTYKSLKQYDQAVVDYTQAIKLNPYFFDAYNNRGINYKSLKQYDLAIADYNQAIKVNPNFAIAYNNRGNIYSDLKQYDLAIADYNQAIKLNPEYVNAYSNRGNTYNALKQHDLAISDLNQAIKINPEFSDAYNNRGNTYNALKQYDQAIVDYTQTIKLNPKNANAYYNRGNTYNALKQYDQAIVDYTQAIKINPNFGIAYNNRGLAYNDLKHYDQAIVDYAQAIKINPNFAIAYNNRGQTYILLKQYDQAIVDYTQAIKLNPKDANAYGSRGIAYREVGNNPQAKKDLQTAAKLFYQKHNFKLYQFIIERLREL